MFESLQVPITCRDGIQLQGELQKRQSDQEGIAVLLHGRLHNRLRGPMAGIERLLPFSTFSFDARGMGLSQGVTSYSNVDQEVDDLSDVLHAIAKLPPPYDKVHAIIGHSKGAVVALQAVATNKVDCPHVIALSPRYDSENLVSTNSRFSPQQLEQLESEGSFIWLHYKAGPCKDGIQERRPYLVTRDEVESHAKRKLDCVKQMPVGVKVLCIHGKADGTVPYEHSLKVDRDLKQSEASSDVFLLEGVAHNWDNPGESQLLASLISSWLSSRTKMTPEKNDDLVDHLGQHRKRRSGQRTNDA